MGGSLNPKNVKKCMKLNFNFQRSGVGIWKKKNPFCGEGMDIFWNYTLCLLPIGTRVVSVA